MAAARASG
jgi:hypothetical protein